MRLALLLPLLFQTLVFAQVTKSHVTAKLTANRAGIVKGERFMVGIHLKMSDHWHTYWENPGFSGLPTTWDIEAPPGLKLGELQFPLPKKFTDDAGFVTYGYDDETLLIAEAVYDGAADKIEIKAKIDWLECKELCIPGSAEGALKIAVGASKPANQALFDKYTALVPQPFTNDAPFVYESEFTLEAEQWRGRLRVTPKAGRAMSKDDLSGLRFFPLATEDGELKQSDVVYRDGAYVFDLRYEAFEEKLPADFAIGGVVALPIDGGLQVARLQLYPPPGAGGGAASAAASGGGYAFWTVLLLAFLGGMILNLMPCVLPVLSLKVFSLLKEAGESASRRRRFGWVYAFGIMACFLALSLFFVAAKSAGERLGVGFQFQSPGFVVVISALIFVMGLSFLGVFHIGAPNSNKLYNLSARSGYQGAFFQGVLMTVLSTPCTAPALGAAYGWAISQTAPLLILIFQVVALGLAFPYLLLCYAPVLLKVLPKPGPWMNTFKIAMGFLLIATVIWLMSVLATLTGPSGVVGLATVLLALSAAAMVFGRAYHGERRVAGLAFAVVLTAAGVYLGLFRLFDIREPFKDVRAAREDLRLEIMSELAANGAGFEDVYADLEKRVTTADQLAWVPYSPNNLSYFQKKNRVVFMDFTAEWCLTCKANEKLVIDTRKIRELFARERVVAMKADYTDKDDHLTELIHSFNRAGVPLYVVYPGEGEPILLPETITPSMVVAAVEDASAQIGQRTSLK